MTMKNATLAVLTAASIFVAASTAAAQTVRGTLQGLVVDGTGGVVAGAQVIVTSDATGARQSVRTDDRGWFVVTPIDPGTYQLEVTHTGFRKHLQSFTLQVNQRLRLDVVLQPGQVTETVTVVAPATVDRTATSLSSRFDPDRIANLPLDGRNFLDLALLTAGAAPAAQGSAGSVRGDFAFNVNGAREDANTFLLDGAYNFDPKLNSVAVRPPVDAIREFEVIGSTPDATFGKSAGAQVNVITRSGANRLSATGYEFWRTAAFNARNYFAPENEPAPEYRRHQYGAVARRPDQERSPVLLRRLRGHAAHRRHHAGDQRADARRARRRFLGQPVHDRRIFPAGKFRCQAIRFRLHAQNPIGRAIAASVSAAEPGRAVREFRVLARADRRRRSVRYPRGLPRRRPDVTSRYSFSDRRLFEPFAGPGVLGCAGLRQRRAAARAELRRRPRRRKPAAGG